MLSRIIERIEELDAVSITWVYDKWACKVLDKHGKCYFWSDEDFEQAVRGALIRRRKKLEG